MDGQRVPDQVERKNRAAAFPQAEIEVQQRSKAEGFEQMDVPWLGRLVARDQKVWRSRTQAAPDEGGGAAYETVDDNGDAFGCRREHHSNQPRDLESAERRQHCDRVALIRPVDGDRALDDRELAGQPCVVDARPPSADIRSRQGEKDGRESAG